MVRHPYFAGQFYPKGKEELGQQVKQFVANGIPAKTMNSSAFIAPHAGYEYSGSTAGYTYGALLGSSALESTDTIVIIGPNHTGQGVYSNPISISGEDWEVPLGTAKNDIELSGQIASLCDMSIVEESAHNGEHSLEVQLPFMHSLFESKRFVFICLGDQSLRASLSISNAVQNAAKMLDRRIMVVASSDMNHYEPADVAVAKDTPLIEKIKAMDSDGFEQERLRLEDTACGHGAIAAAMMYSRSSGCSSCAVLNYSNSGDANHDYSSVVAYLSAAFVV